jgi:acyl-CoA synthetase (NDP forming)
MSVAVPPAPPTQTFLDAGIPVFRSVERACRAIYKATSYYRNRDEARGS